MEGQPDTVRVSGLPPRELWLHNPDIDGLLETPLDERGLVDLDALVGVVRSTIEPGYTWHSPFNDVHHLQWKSTSYKGESKEETQSMVEFRELSSRKAYVPRFFHAWTHRLTAPPPVPDKEVMKYSVDAERVALSLANTAILATRLSRSKRFTEKIRTERIKSHFDEYITYVDNARLVPSEFQRVPFEVIDIQTYEELPLVARELGRLAIDRIPERRRALIAA